jgi:hypothetical protein
MYARKFIRVSLCVVEKNKYIIHDINIVIPRTYFQFIL